MMKFKDLWWRANYLQIMNQTIGLTTKKNYQDVIPINREYETKEETKEEIYSHTGYGCVSNKFKSCNDFLNMVKELGISRSSAKFKMNLF